MIALPDGWREEQLGTVTLYRRAFGPLSIAVHPGFAGGWERDASLGGDHVDIDPDQPDLRFDDSASAIAAADAWLVATGMAIASAMYDARLIP